LQKCHHKKLWLGGKQNGGDTLSRCPVFLATLFRRVGCRLFRLRLAGKRARLARLHEWIAVQNSFGQNWGSDQGDQRPVS
jgi:hypothetical protein